MEGKRLRPGPLRDEAARVPELRVRLPVGCQAATKLSQSFAAPHPHAVMR
jgi:hypothetical protein